MEEADIKRLEKLKSLLDAGAITREEFDKGKRAIIGRDEEEETGVDDPVVARLRQLKTLYESGALSEEEYEEQKELVLDNM